MEGTTVRRLVDSEQAWQLNRLLGAPAACSRTKPRRYAYAGNRPDVAMFPAVVDELVARYRGLAAADTELTVVFDAGQNVAANFAHLAEPKPHFVGSLPPSDHPRLLAVPARRRTMVDAERIGGLTNHETPRRGLGAQRRVVLTHSPTLHAMQSAGLDQTLAKATRALAELAGVLEGGATTRPAHATEMTPSRQQLYGIFDLDRYAQRPLTGLGTTRGDGKSAPELGRP